MNPVSTGQCRNVVVVEDESMVRDLAVCELEDGGYQVVDFATADAALLYLMTHAETTAVVFTDVQMPGVIDGLGLTATISRQWPDIKVLVTSGGASVDPRGLPPCARFVPKPWRAADILDRVACLTAARVVKGAVPAIPQPAC